MTTKLTAWDRSIRNLRRVDLWHLASLLSLYSSADAKSRRSVLLRVRYYVMTGGSLSGRRAESLCKLLKEAHDAIPVIRERRCKLVRVPEKWVGCVTSDQTKNARREVARLKRQERRKQFRDEATFDLKHQ